MAAAFLLADLAAFFDPDEFADAAVFEGDTATVNGIFDNAYDLAQLGFAEAAATAPVFILQTSDVPANVHNRYLRFGNLLAGGARYQVVESIPSGTGLTILRLRT